MYDQIMDTPSLRICSSSRIKGEIAQDIFVSQVLVNLTQGWDGKNTHNRALNFYPSFIPLFEDKVSGVSVQDMLLQLPFLKPDT